MTAILVTLRAHQVVCNMRRDYNIAWEVTENCNHNCFYCYNFWRGNTVISDGFVGFNADYKRVTDKLIDLHPLSVALTGGEPLLVFKKIKESITRFTENGIFVRVLTNGSLVTDEIASFLAQHHIQVMVSFPTSDSDQFLSIIQRNHYKDVLLGLDLLKKHNVDVLINIVISTVNLNNMEATADFLIGRYGFRTLYFSRATKPQNASVELQERLLDNAELQKFFNACLIIKKRYKIDVRTCGGYAYCAIRNKKAFSIFAKGCGGGRNSFVVSNDGSLRICGKDSKIFGNIFETDVDKIMDRAGFWIDETAIPKECDQCQYRQQCRGGCHMSSLEKHPKYNSLDCNADPSRGSIRIPRRKHFNFLNPLKKYVLNKTSNYCKTNNGNRFSNTFSFVYLSDELTNILISGSRISLFTVVRRSGCSFKKSKQLFSEMINKRIIMEIH